MRAEEIVVTLLEAAPRGAVLAFSDGTPTSAFYGNKLEDVLAHFRNLRMVSAMDSPARAMDRLIQQHNLTFVLQKVPGDVHVYSRRIPVPLDKQATERLMQVFGIDSKQGQVAWSRSPLVRGNAKLASDVFGSMSEREGKERQGYWRSAREAASLSTS